MKLFHVTFGIRLKSIMKNGLIPNFYDNFSGPENTTKGVYLTNNPEFIKGLISEDSFNDELSEEDIDELLDDIVVLEVEIQNTSLLTNDPHLKSIDENLQSFIYNNII